MKLKDVISLTLLAIILGGASIDFVIKARASPAEHGNLIFDLFEQLYLASMVCIFELGTGNSAIGRKRSAIWYPDHVSFLVANLAHFLFSDCKNFGCPELLLLAEP